MITFHDPRGEVATESTPYDLEYIIPGDGDGVTVGLLANGFPDSQAFLEKLGEAISAKFSKVQIKIWNKGNAAIPAPEEMLAEIESQCQVAIAAYGH